MTPVPEAQHRWLQRLCGRWTSETDMDMGPGRPRERSTGTEEVRSLGALWVVAEGCMALPGAGAPAHTLLTLGYNPRRQAFVGTWAGSMMSHLWVYEGRRTATDSGTDAAPDAGGGQGSATSDGGDGEVLVLETSGPSMGSSADPAPLVRYRDTLAWQDNAIRTLEASVQRADGSWHRFMKTVYRRVT